MTVPQLKPPAPYYGGKTRLAPWIVSLMSPHQRYIEPFCGTASVLLAKPRSRFEVINDLDSEVVNFFTVLRDRPAELERACRFTPYSRAEFQALRERNVDESIDPVERARRWWVRVAIEHSPALTLVERFDHPDAVIYCDPPYLGTTRAGRERRSRTLDYAHDMTSDEEHTALAEVLAGCEAHVLLSGYDSPLYEDLYAGWDRVECTVVRSAASRRGSSTRTHATEVVWSNRPLMSDEHLLTHLDTQETR